MNFCIPDHSTTNLLLETETTIQSLPVCIQNKTRIITHQKIIKHSNKPKQKNMNEEIKTLKDIVNKLEVYDATALKADKGNTVVIMNNKQYHEKILDFITQNNIKKLPKDPTQKFHNQIKNLINKSTFLTPNQKIFCRTIKPNAPKFRGQPKIHKDNEPIRPVVNAINSPTHKIAKLLDKIIRQEIILENNRSLKNREDLINKIQNIPCPNSHLLTSFDIKNLYTNIPVEETLTILEKNLKKTNHLDNDKITEIINLTKMTLSQNYFEYNGDFYTQERGLAMGSPLSSIMADIFLNHIENNYILNNQKNPLVKNIVYYHRYVDDILCLFNGNTRQIDILTKFFNNIHPNIQFTAEIEQSNQINFLDLSIIKIDNKHQFKIFRKPTTTDQIIHNSSNHPISHKHAAFHSLIHRLLNTPLSKMDYITELNIIKQIAVNNGYNTKLIDKLIWKHKNKKKGHSQHIQQNEYDYVLMTYHGKINNSIHNEFTKQGFKVAYKSKNNIKQFLHNKKEKHNHSENKFEGTGVYKLNCSSCPKFYIGQTGRSFKTRYKEHLPKNQNYNQSTFAEHLIQEDHSFSSIHQDLEIIHLAPKSKKLDIIEQFHIYKNIKENPTKILNDKINFQANIVFDTIINLTQKS